ncbi:sensor histidine kinase [Azospirillum doebereinerae]
MAMGLESGWDASGFVPHGVCLLWRTDILALHVAADVLTGLSYFSIPLALLYFVHRRRDIDFGWVALLFALFIVACGSTHFFSVWTLWNADYVTEGAIKAFTALVSLLTAATLWVLMPRLLALPSPRQLAEANAALHREVEIRKQAEQRYSGFFNNLAEALFIVSVQPDGQFVFDAINPALARVTGLDPEHLRGRPVAEALGHELADSVLVRYVECRDAGVPVDYEETLDLPAGRRVFHTVLVPVSDADGRVVQILGSGRDITERKRFQEDAVQTTKMATLGTLAAGMAHEMSQPLNVIRLWTENTLTRLREGGADSDRIERAMTLVISQTERMGKLIDHVRMFGRRDDGGYRGFAPGETVRNALDLVRHQYELENIALFEDVAPVPGEVRGRPLQLEQVVLNLLSNARDAIQARRAAGGDAGRIDVLVQGDETLDFAVIQVTDDGGGIDATILPRIFDPFFTTKDVGSGTGLGLSIGYGIIDSMNGRIEAVNVELDDGRRGVRFTVTLPLQPLSVQDRELSHA